MKPPKEQKPPLKWERLTVQQSRRRLWIPAVSAIPLALYTVREIDKHHILGTVFFSMLTFLQFISFPIRWRQHQLIKNGAEIYTQSQPTTHVPVVLSILVTGALTALVAVASIGSFFLFRSAIMTLTVMTVFCGINFFLWLLVAFLWYRCLVPAKIVPEQLHAVPQEGVWPPAPLVNKTEGNGVDDI